MIASRRAHVPEADGCSPLADVLARIAEELELTRSLGLRVEGAICAAALASRADAAALAELQHFDLMLQRIVALREFTHELSRRCDSMLSLPVDGALALVTLEDLRARLRGARAEEAPADVWEIG